ncbi:MAG: hypothetical protein C0467_06080 [Planctomycetaceae bacterium]|nr:hypothetical protein [Planctomycetaceae bacterium]
MTYLERSATISPCGLYRYDLKRTWDVELPTLVFCMLNPSTADGKEDDSTIIRCVGFAKQWGYGSIVVVNLFAFRSTDPNGLKTAADPVGPENDSYILEHARGRTVIAAWGMTAITAKLGAIRLRPAAVEKILAGFGKVRCLGLTKAGQPKHPLYQASDSPILCYPGGEPDVLECGHPNTPANWSKAYGCVACDCGPKAVPPDEVPGWALNDGCPLYPHTSPARKGVARAGEASCTIHGMDCIRGMAENLAPESVHLTVTSIPFEELFTYSGKPEDVGNNGSTVDIRNGRFALNMRFVVEQLFRATAPGCNVCIHIQQLLAYKNQHGFMGRRDFRGSMIDVFGAGGFQFTGEFAIQKNPQAMAQRLSLHSLQFKTGYGRDSTLLAPCPNDYVLIFHKPGTHPCPPRPLIEERKNPHGWMTTEEWVRDAHGIWTDILEVDVLDRPGSLREADHERHVCIARGSLVLTSNGHKPIEDVSVGDLVLTHLGRWRPVTAKACNGVKPVVRVKAHGVADLKCTPDHKLFMRKTAGSRSRDSAERAEPQWIPASEASTGYVNLKLPPIHDRNELTRQEWWIVGRWLADGHCGVKGDWFVSVGPDKVGEFVQKVGHHAGANRELDAVQFRLKGLRPELIQVLEECGSGAANKRIPPRGLLLSSENARELLAGYLSGDGHYLESRKRWMATSVSRELLLGVAMLAQRVHAAISCVYAGKRAGQTVIEGRLVNTKQEWVLSFDVPGGRRQTPFVLEDGAWKKVRSVESAGEAEVWDLQVEEDESFTVEGCIVHNCPLQLEVIRRLVRLYTNPISVQPNVTVLDPFMGIGSTAWVCLNGPTQQKYTAGAQRNVVGFELKESYHAQALANVAKLRKQQKKATAVKTLLDTVGA